MDTFWVYTLVTVLLWGILPIAQVVYSRSFHAATLAAIFFAMCIAVSPLVYAAFSGVIFAEIGSVAQQQPIVLAATVFGVLVTVASTYTYTRALQVCGDRAAIVVVATCAYPIVTALLMAWIFNDRISPLMWLGIVTIVVGCVLVGIPSSRK